MTKGCWYYKAQFYNLCSLKLVNWLLWLCIFLFILSGLKGGKQLKPKFLIKQKMAKNMVGTQKGFETIQKTNSSVRWLISYSYGCSINRKYRCLSSRYVFLYKKFTIHIFVGVFYLIKILVLAWLFPFSSKLSLLNLFIPFW